MAIQMTTPQGIKVGANGVEGIIIALAWAIFVLLYWVPWIWLKYMN